MSQVPPFVPDVTLELTEPELVRLAERMAPWLQVGDCLALMGDLGAGKSTFARALIRALARDNQLDVPSPTFALRQDYDTDVGPVAHFDLYRLDDARDLDELAFDEALAEAIAIVEWPERAAAALPSSRIDIHLSDTGDPTRRRFALKGHGVASVRLAALRVILRAIVTGVQTTPDQTGDA